jgi:hypothetical protein
MLVSKNKKLCKIKFRFSPATAGNPTRRVYPGHFGNISNYIKYFFYSRFFGGSYLARYGRVMPVPFLSFTGWLSL